MRNQITLSGHSVVKIERGRAKQMIPSPRNYDLPHDEWRHGQYEMTQTLLGKREGSVTILQAPTGSGKTGLARAIASRQSVTALVKTKVLQQSNYANTYKFDLLFGRANYSCIHPEQVANDAGADQCLYEAEMDQCDLVDSCPYVMQKRLTQRSRVRSLNYSYFLTSRWPRQEKFASQYLFVDECHLLSDETVEWTGLMVREVDRVKWRLSEFPSCYQSSPENTRTILGWMERAIGELDVALEGLSNRKDAGSLARKSGAERLKNKLTFTCGAIHHAPYDWYCRSGIRALEYMGQPRPGLVIRPLTAKHHFPRLFLGVYPKVVMMSATVGAPEFLAEELGLQTWEFERIPNQWGPERRPVHVLPCPVLGYNSPESYYVKQAELIRSALDALPRDWSGIIHVTSWKHAQGLSQRLVGAGFDASRLFVPKSGRGTNEQLAEWDRVKLSRPGMLILTPSMSEGVDLLNERICIVAKVPFPSRAPGSYDHERMLYSSDLYKLRTAWSLEQRCGRTRRGREEDYDASFERRGYVAICDGAFQKMGVKKYCSEDFREALIYD